MYLRFIGLCDFNESFLDSFDGIVDSDFDFIRMASEGISNVRKQAY